MKKFAIPLIIGSLSLTGCMQTTGTNTNNQSVINPTTAINTGMIFGKAVFQSKIRIQCQTALNSNTLWRSTKLFLSGSKKAEIPNQICGCVALEGSKNITLDQLTIAAVDKTSRNALISNAVNSTLNTCVKRYIYK